jgi:2-furoyl-CoA dehydrogenase large subunit
VHWDPGALPPGVPPRLATEGEFRPPEAVAATAEDTINSSLCYGFVAEMVGVRIDADTLEITMDRVASVHDAGTVLDPVLLEGQVHGALVHGLGGALYEEFRYSEAGQPQSATFLDYLCPTAAETGFELVSDHLESPSPLTPLGAKGCGEGSSMSLPVAIANAVADALAPAGVAIDSLPLHGEALFALLERND